MSADHVPLTTRFFHRLAALDVDVDAVLQRARVRPRRAAVTTHEYFRIWRAIAELAPAPDIGLRLGGDGDPRDHNVAMLAAVHAPTLGDGLARLARYKRLACAEEVVVVPRGHEVEIGFRWLHAVEAPPPPWVDCVFAALLALVRDGTGTRIVPRRIALSRPRARAALLRRHFGCRIAFDAPADHVVLDAKVLTQPFRTRDDDVCARLLPALEAAVEKRSQTRSITEQVRAALGRRLNGEPIAIERLARELHVTPRTLQRRLAAAGTSYRALLDRVRHDSARRLLAATELDVAEIAFLLGFVELNSFTRAFRGWEGTSPLRWRNASTSHP